MGICDVRNMWTPKQKYYSDSFVKYVLVRFFTFRPPFIAINLHIYCYIFQPEISCLRLIWHNCSSPGRSSPGTSDKFTTVLVCYSEYILL